MAVPAPAGEADAAAQGALSGVELASAADGGAVSTFGVIPAAIRAEGEEWSAHVGGTSTPSGTAEEKDVGAEGVKATATPPWPDAGRVRISGNWAGSSQKAGLPRLLMIDVDADASELEEWGPCHDGAEDEGRAC